MYKAKPDDTIVLIPSLRMHHLDTIDQIMREKVARGFIGAKDRVNKMTHVVIVEKGNKAYFAKIEKVISDTITGKSINTNDIYFSNAMSIPLSVLKDCGININSGRSSIRYGAIYDAAMSVPSYLKANLSFFG